MAPYLGLSGSGIFLSFLLVLSGDRGNHRKAL